jgi:hypothetical protein
MLRKLATVAVVATGISGCATPSAPEPDTTPLLPTAVIESRVVNEGVKGLFPSETVERSYVRANMRRDETMVQGTGTVTRFLVSTRSEARIWRLDRDLLWALNVDKSEYAECPLQGCAAPAKAPAEDEKPVELVEPGCTMKVTATSFTVQPTGKKRTINGFSAEEYDIAWKVVFQDIIERQATSTVSINLWTTPITAPISKVLEVEQAYAKALAGKTPGATRAPLLPPEIGQMVAGGLGGALTAADRERAALFSTGKQMDKVKGYPVSKRIEWRWQGDACEIKPAEASGFSGLFSRKKTDTASEDPKAKPRKRAKDEAPVAKAATVKPVVSLLSEVKAIKMDLVRESMFNVPSGFKQTN